jgi:hypothetical protein
MGSPAAGLVGADAFSVRWTNTVNFPKGIYRFRATVDDGVRVFVDDQLVIDGWRVQAVATFDSADRLGGGCAAACRVFRGCG